MSEETSAGESWTSIAVRAPAGEGHTPVTDYTMFYEHVDGLPVRRMEPIRVAWRRLGSGPRMLVCVHSINRAASTFEPLAEALAATAEVVAIDLRGFGASHRPTAAATVAELTADVLRVGAELGESRPLLYGHGFGACVALAAARQLSSGAVVSGVAFAAGEPQAVARLEAAGGDGAAGVELPRALGSGKRADVNPLTVGQVAQAWRAFAAAADELPPLLALAGSDDGVTPADGPGGAAWAATAGHGRLVIVDGAGHDLPREGPEEIAAAIGEWMQELTSGGPDGRA